MVDWSKAPTITTQFGELITVYWSAGDVYCLVRYSETDPGTAYTVGSIAEEPLLLPAELEDGRLTVTWYDASNTPTTMTSDDRGQTWT
jgi:hypothetical protein